MMFNDRKGNVDEWVQECSLRHHDHTEDEVHHIFLFLDW